MTRNKTRIAALILSVALSLPLLTSMASAHGEESGQARGIFENDELLQITGETELALRPIANKNVYTYSTKNISYAAYGKSGTARIINGIEYVSLRAFASAIGGSVTYSSSTRTSTMRYGSLTFTVSDGAYVAYANGRPLFALGPSAILSDGLMYVPIETLAKSMGMRISKSAWTLTLGGTATPLSAKTPYSEDEVFWLARIIEAESGGESLLGKLGVGTVVLNRVASPLYPNTIYGVIFDRKYGVQFSPVLDGRIYNTPSYQARLAARICLEGTRLSDRALFFLAPEFATSSWIPKSREYLFSIMHHDFYA